MFERFRSSPPRLQLAMIVAAATLLSLVLIAVWYFALRVRYETIFTQLRPTDAAALVSELDKRKIPYRLGESGTTISVPEDKAAATRLSLVASNVALKGEVGFELFDKSDMGITDFAQKINFQRALQGELERTISLLDGVDLARVHLSMGDDRLFRQERAPPKASVTLRMRDGALVQAATVAGVQELVSASVPRLDAASVVVLDETGRVMSAGPVASPSSPQMAERRAAEEYLEAQVRAIFDRVFGPDYVTVSVRAEGPPIATESGSVRFDLVNRNFPVRVTLRPQGELAEDVRDGMRNLVDGAVGLNESLGDVVEFGAPQALVRDAPPPAAGARPAKALAAHDVEKGKSGTGFLVAGVVGLGLLCLALLLVLVRRPGVPPPFEEGQRTSFAGKLQSLLEEEAVDGAAQV